MMRMRLLSFMGMVYVYLFRSLVLVVEMHDRLQVIAFHMSINAPASHCPMRGGVIPACAGNTCRSPSNSPCRWDHPRVCGEHSLIERMGLSGLGSSPRVRGTLHEAVSDSRLHGIIPACAGNTDRRRGSGARRRDHPRVCGEHVILIPPFVSLPGSSPRVRGTQYTRWELGWLDGIIPACAGNTTSWGSCRPSSRDHPRVCGEHSATLPTSEPMPGSSPRVRGTRTRLGMQLRMPGIIPACAGNTYRR